MLLAYCCLFGVVVQGPVAGKTGSGTSIAVGKSGAGNKSGHKCEVSPPPVTTAAPNPKSGMSWTHYATAVFP